MERILSALRDINGVVGSFVLARNGNLLSREMPSLYPDSVFPEIGRRLEGMSEALETQRGPYTEMVLKFDAYWLLTRRTPHGSLNILTTETVNYPALRMATNVALKQIEEAMASAPVQEAPAPELVEPIPVAPSTEPAKPRRMWRGQLLD